MTHKRIKKHTKIYFSDSNWNRIKVKEILGIKSFKSTTDTTATCIARDRLYIEEFQEAGIEIEYIETWPIRHGYSNHFMG